jgi:hypothetical protein
MFITATIIHYCREKLTIKQCKFFILSKYFTLNFEGYMAPMGREGNPI